MAATDQEFHEQADQSAIEWGTDAPRGGKAVMSRLLKENGTVPLFFGQTLIQSLRDVGYNPDEAEVRPPQVVENYEQ